MLTAPQTGSGCHRSVCRTDKTFAALPAGEAHVRSPRPPCRPQDWDQHMGSTPHPTHQPHPPPRGARAHMVCSRGFPRKAFSGMALMLLLWKPLGDNTGVRETPGRPPAARQEGWGQKDAAGDPGDPLPALPSLGRRASRLGVGVRGERSRLGPPRAELCRVPGRARGGAQRDRGSWRRCGHQREAGLVSRP